ncbi:hypothetical protein GH741_01560 [Aquibacillus halophilus]|uniref:Uncharacterized protein n=1 Tax=Aquibacillus halophilus TaxID=930132 RepID=A0A6A8DEL9_9BACI|nr:hypothetical protein [Aquibacillus halophilus]MRH41357.1 hypothetical protein [Aquibacillus halophilus]
MDGHKKMWMVIIVFVFFILVILGLQILILDNKEPASNPDEDEVFQSQEINSKILLKEIDSNEVIL